MAANPSAAARQRPVRFQRKGHRMNRLFVQRCVRISCRLLLLAMLSAASLAAEIHVSPSGCDDQPGTPAAPVQTLEKARVLARSLRAGRPTEAVSIFLHPGRHMIRKTVAFGPEDSGTAEAPLKILARHDPAARLRGRSWWAARPSPAGKRARGTTDRMSGRPIWGRWRSRTLSGRSISTANV